MSKARWEYEMKHGMQTAKVCWHSEWLRARPVVEVNQWAVLLGRAIEVFGLEGLELGGGA